MRKWTHLRSVFAVTILLAATWPAKSCQLSRTSPSEADATEDIDDPVTFNPPLAPPAFDRGSRVFNLIRGTGTMTAKVGHLASSQCQDQLIRSPEVRIRTYLRTSLGWHTVDFTLEGSDSLNLGDPVRPDLVHAEVEGHQLSFTSKASVAAGLKARACLAANSDQPDLYLSVDQSLIENIRDWLKAVSPACTRVDMLSNGFECPLSPQDPARAMEQLAHTQRTMVLKWSRQPYLFARRVAIGLNLAGALGNQTSEGDLNTFCKIISTAAPGELPITLSSKRWQQEVCHAPSKNRRQLALFGLAKTVEELNFLSQLFDATSRLGSLAIKIPDADLPEKQILLNLTPEIDVADTIASEAARIISQAQKIENWQNRQICWHPVYGESAAMLKTALGLGLITGEGRALCKVSPQTYNDSQPALSTADRYIAESITSETEFIVANGQSKTLRLPAGKYSYSLRGLPNNHEGWDDASQYPTSAGGMIEWDQRKPRAIISKW